MHTTVAYVSISFTEEDTLLFKDIDMLVIHRTELKEIESIQMNQGKIMIFCKLQIKSTGNSPSDLVLKTVSFNSDLLCNAI